MPVVLASEALEALSYESWEFMFNGEGKLPPLDPEVSIPLIRDYKLTAVKDPMAIETHKKVLTAILTHDFDLERATRALTNGHMGAADYNERSRTFRLRLIEFMKTWCKNNL